MLHALLVGNGEILPATRLQELAREADFILAADGGADHALQNGLVPDLVIGDLDSASSFAHQKLPREKFLFIDNQNNTDLEKALLYLTQHGCKKCTLAGFLGGRWDFSLGNLLALTRFARQLDICIVGANWRGFLLSRSRRFACVPGKRVSLLPLKPCSGVTLTGLLFPLKQARLPMGTTRSLSNKTVKNMFTVSLAKGQLLVYVED